MLKVQKTNLFLKWIDRLKDNKLKLSIERKIDRIKDDDYLGKTKPIGDGVSEIKIDMGAGYRIYFNVYIKGSEVWLLNGGDKSTQQRDIEVAKELLQEIQQQREAKK